LGQIFSIADLSLSGTGCLFATLFMIVFSTLSAYAFAEESGQLSHTGSGGGLFDLSLYTPKLTDAYWFTS